MLRWIARAAALAVVAVPVATVAVPSDAAPVTPTLTVTASGDAPLSTVVSAKAMLSGTQDSAGGTVTFDIYGPNDPTCTGTPYPANSIAGGDVSGDGTYTSAGDEPPSPGDYSWVASYSGDPNNASVTTACGSTGSTFTVTKAATTIKQMASNSVPVGGLIADSVILSNLDQSAVTTGSILFQLYGPDDGDTCQPDGDDALASARVDVDDGIDHNNSTEYSSPAVVAQQAGTYYWEADYSGDDNNAPAGSDCATVVVTKGPATSKVALTLSTTALRFGHENKETFSVKVTTTPSGLVTSGTVKVKTGSNALCTVTLNKKGKGSCSLTKKQLKVGISTIGAKYAGKSGVKAAESNQRTLLVKK